MDRVLVKGSDELETLTWLAAAFASTIRNEQTKLYSYLEAISDEVEFEMRLEEGG